MSPAELLQTENAIFLIKSSDLQDFATQIINQVLSDKPKPTEIGPNCAVVERPFSQSEAIRFLGKSRQTFYTWRKRGIIQPYRLGGRIFYKPSELVAALEKLG